MSVLMSISTLLSLLSFLTTVFALARVGAAAFSANQPNPNFASSPGPFQIPTTSGNNGMSLSQAFRLGTVEKEEDDVVGYLGGHELVRMPSASWAPIRKGLLHPPPAPLPEQHRPLSMAKLIMSRHNQRRPVRPPPVRRPPGLPSSRSGLVQEVV